MFDKIKTFDYHDLAPKLFLGAQGPLMLMG